ncbi:MAG: sigma-70 family RNA polymerase sigma factor [Eubacteriales bacterium]|nr:sigma-70 family RNA polymerase sigma factor [Eubacteriales bacterium]
MNHFTERPLPEPLSPEQEGHILRQLGTGSDEMARTLLMEHNLRLVVWIVDHSYKDYPEQEELISVGNIGLIKGVRTFDPERKKKLSTYVGSCIRNEIRMYLRKNSRNRRLTEFPGDDENVMAEWTVEEQFFSREMEERQVLYEALSTLSGKEQWLLRERYGLSEKKPMTQREIANVWKVSQSYVSRVERKAVHHLRTAIGQKEL